MGMMIITQELSLLVVAATTSLGVLKLRIVRGGRRKGARRRGGRGLLLFFVHPPRLRSLMAF